MHAHPWNEGFGWTEPDVAPRLLSPDDVARFHAEGWLVVDDLVDEAALAELREELDAIEAEVDGFLRTQPGERVMIAESGAITFAPHVVTRSAAARRISRHPRIAALVHDLVGAEARLYWDQLVYKKPDKPRVFPWHQDNGYTYVEPQQYLTVWLALTDAGVDDGCPWVVPGVHRRGTLAHEYVDPLGYRCFVDHPDAVAAPVRAGGAVVFSSLTPHMTGPNVGDAVRRTYILQYAPDGAEVLEGDPAAGPPAGRVRQDDPARQYPVVVDGEPVGD